MNEVKHHWPKEQCYYCGKEAIARCDGVNHFLVNSEMIICADNPNAIDYCDRPLCEDHAEVIGMSTASGNVDTIDYCPKHTTMRKMGEPVKLVQKNN